MANTNFISDKQSFYALAQKFAELVKENARLKEIVKQLGGCSTCAHMYKRFIYADKQLADVCESKCGFPNSKTLDGWELKSGGV